MQTLTAADFLNNSYQATIFTPDGDLSVSNIMKDFYPSQSNFFDGEPTILPPIPEGAPLEIPRIILVNKTGEWRCEMSPARINMFWRRTKTTTTDINIVDFFKKAVDILLRYHNSANARIGRLAGIVARFAEQDTPGLFLARHFCREQWEQAPLNRPENFELHAHKAFDLGGKMKVNSWARNKTGKLVVDGIEKPIVLFEQDINTLADELSSIDLKEVEINHFFDVVAVELDTILGLYYPETRNG